jgi:predicted RNA-binding protein with PIN domain
MSLHYLLDGYNLIHSAALEKLSLTARKFSAAQQRRNDERSEEFSCQIPALSQQKLEDQRKQLVRWVELQKPQGSLKNCVTIVFDGKGGIWSRADPSTVKVQFSKDESADSAIKRIVARSHNKKNIVVVTNDREIQYAVCALGAKINSVEEFLSKAKPQGSLHKEGKEQTGQGEPSKRISKTLESKITSEFKEIWLKQRNAHETDC